MAGIDHGFRCHYRADDDARSLLYGSRAHFDIIEMIELAVIGKALVSKRAGSIQSVVLVVQSFGLSIAISSPANPIWVGMPVAI